jgi:hypothetical protein
MSLRKNLIALSLFNAANMLQEQEEAAPAPAMAPAAPQPTTPDPTETSSPVDEQGNEITLDKMIDRINIIRSGLSFEEPEVYGKLTTMFKGMPIKDKKKLYKQLTDISAIVQNIPAEKQQGQQTDEVPPPPQAQAVPPVPAEVPPPAPPPVTA